MPGGETIGEAWIRIRATGDDLDDDIRKKLRESNNTYREGGKEHGKTYAGAFGDSSDHRFSDLAKKTTERFRKMFRDIDADGNKVTFADKIGDKLTDTFRRADFQVGKFRSDIDRFYRQVSDQGPLVTMQNGFRRVGFWVGDAQGKLDNFGRSLRSNKRDIKDVGYELGQFTERGTHLGRVFRAATPDIGGFFRGLERGKKDAVESHGFFATLAADILSISDSSGRAFGKGSRNDFLNFIGSSVDKMIRLIAVIPSVTDKFGTFFTTLKDGPKTLEGLGAAFGSISTEGASLAPLLAGAGIAAAALVLIVPTLVSILTLLSGVVVALAASISFALIGALGALGGLLIPLGAAVGVLALAFGGLGSRTSEAHKQLSAFIKPVTSQLKELALVTKQHLFGNLAKDGENFGKGLGTLRPLVVSTADALSKMFSDVAKASASPAFADYIKAIEAFTKTALPQLGQIFGDTFKGIGGVFLTLIPLTQRFLDSMSRGSKTFDEFANSADGQNKLELFFKRAGDSAASLGHLLGDTTKLLGTLFSASQSTGDTIIDHLDKKVREFTAYLKANPKVVANFFSDVGDFADGVGRATLAILHMIDSLDSPSSRRQATAIFEAIGSGIDNLIPVFRLLETVAVPILQTVGFVVTALASPFKTFFHLLSGDFGAALADFIGIGTSFLKAIGSIGSALGHIPGVPDLGKPFKAAAADLQHLQDQLNGKPIKPKVDPSELGVLTKYAHTTDESLRILLGLPKIKPKVDPSEIKGATTSTDLLIDRANDFRGMPGARVKVNKTESDAAKLSMLLAQTTFINLDSKLGRTLKIKINAAQAKLAGDIIEHLKDLFAGFRDKTVTLRVNLPTNAQLAAINAGRGATGGISMPFGGVAKRFGAGGIAAFQQLISGGNTGGEAGREAIVPLDRPLGQVDPSVRYLAAVARGLNPGGISSVTNNLTVVTPTTNPRAVAVEAINALTAQAV